MAEIKSESVADFIPESVADLLRNQHLWPMIVPPAITLWDAAAAPRSQAFLMVGTLFLLPLILGYTAWSYWVFRGKVRRGTGYH